MRHWHSLFDAFKRKSASLEAQNTLTDSYRSVFLGSPEHQQQQMVLADLRAKCKFDQVSAGISNEELWRREGMRTAFAFIMSHLDMGEADLEALRVAARREAAFADTIKTRN